MLKQNSTSNYFFNKYQFLSTLGLKEHNLGAFDGFQWQGTEEKIENINPTTNKIIATTASSNTIIYEQCISNMEKVSKRWAEYPMPKRGLIVQQIGDELKKHKTSLGSLLALEMGKIQKEGEGEVQEFIDLCDYAVGLSRTINGKVYQSERKERSQYTKSATCKNRQTSSMFDEVCHQCV